MDDLTEKRKKLADRINAAQLERAELEQKYGQVWDTAEVKRDFESFCFMAPFCGVTRKSDGKKGALVFQHWPRYYWGFSPDSEDVK